MREEKLYDSSSFGEGEADYLRLLKERIQTKATREEIIDLLEAGKKVRKTSFAITLEWNIKGLYELEQKMCSSAVPVKEYRGLTRREMEEKIVDSISLLLGEKFKHPERIFEQKNFRVEFNNMLIDVVEICRKNWEYIFYQSTSYRSEYYVYIDYDRTNEIVKFNEMESELIPSLTIKEIEELIFKYRRENKS